MFKSIISIFLFGAITFSFNLHACEGMSTPALACALEIDQADGEPKSWELFYCIKESDVTNLPDGKNKLSFSKNDFKDLNDATPTSLNVNLDMQLLANQYGEIEDLSFKLNFDFDGEKVEFNSTEDLEIFKTIQIPTGQYKGKTLDIECSI